MHIIEQVQEMQRWSEIQRHRGERIVFVPTWVFFDAHLICARWKKRGDRVVVSFS
jgi:pantothenate synthetase